jgi:hypothetical protein
MTDHLLDLARDRDQQDGPQDEWPEQPDGIDESESEYPDPKRAAERVNEWISEWGDGLIEVLNGKPLYARDLASLAREALRTSADAHPNPLRGKEPLVIGINDDGSPEQAPSGSDLVHGHRQDETCGECVYG